MPPSAKNSLKILRFGNISAVRSGNAGRSQQCGVLEEPFRHLSLARFIGPHRTPLRFKVTAQLFAEILKLPFHRAFTAPALFSDFADGKTL